MNIINKSSKPDNIVSNENKIIERSEEIESALPFHLSHYFLFLRSSVLPSTRLAYLSEIELFLSYLIDSFYVRGNPLHIRDIQEKDILGVTGDEINTYLEYMRRYKDQNGSVRQNDNKALARKKAALLSLYKFLYSQGKMPDITGSVNRLRVPKKTDGEILCLEEDEIDRLFYIAETGEGLSKAEKNYWAKTKLRDKAILIMFITYGLRVSELVQLNLSSINFLRGQFTIYRKGGKVTSLPLNGSVQTALSFYLEGERIAPLEQDRDALFITLKKTRMTARQVERMVKKYTAHAIGDGSGYSPHKLRATTATSLIAKGASIYDVQSLLDHENVTTTQIYARHKKGIAEDLVNMMERKE